MSFFRCIDFFACFQSVESAYKPLSYVYKNVFLKKFSIRIEICSCFVFLLTWRLGKPHPRKMWSHYLALKENFFKISLYEDFYEKIAIIFLKKRETSMWHDAYSLLKLFASNRKILDKGFLNSNFFQTSYVF